MKPPTDVERRALAVLVEAGRRGTTPRAVALRLWPDSPAWHKRTRGRRTGTVSGAMGGTMPMNAARVLWRLHSKGLARTGGAAVDRWYASEAGRGLIEGGHHAR